MSRKGQWVDELDKAVGKYVSLETREGVFREGKISGIRMTEFKINGVVAEVPEEIELNGDIGDLVTVARILSIDIMAGK